MKRDGDIRVLVIDDSAANRRAITKLLEASPGITVVDRAADGEEGLKKAIALKPDVITLDLEMPRLDGFSFLRLLMARAPTPVVVLSSYAHPSDVFKAMQLGAVDFVAKPARGEKDSLETVRHQLVDKVRGVRNARAEQPPRHTPPLPMPAVSAALEATEQPLVVAVAASTGGPPAVQRLLEGLAGLPVCVLVAQHMPPRFTEAFAARLDTTVQFRVSEAKRGDHLLPGQVYIAPGGQQLELVGRAGRLSLDVKASLPSDRFFASVAKYAPGHSLAVVLTGMGNDGAEGVRLLADAGAPVWAEDESSAVIFGMPQAAIETGRVSHVLPLDRLAVSLARAIAERREGARLRTRS